MTRLSYTLKNFKKAKEWLKNMFDSEVNVIIEILDADYKVMEQLNNLDNINTMWKT